MNNRIGDRGVKALVRPQALSPTVRILSLQENLIGGEGILTLASAIDQGFKVRHLNVLDNKCQLTSEMDKLKQAVKMKYIELRAPALQSAKDLMRKS
jgi:Ran GTPase-activating protein (RanGAP) involved in mRNA processing and transport